MTRFREVNHSHYIVGKEKNGKTQGVQSVNNKRTYIGVFDKFGNLIHKWINTPKFIRGKNE